MKFRSLVAAAALMLAQMGAMPASAQKADNILRWASNAPLTTVDPYFNYHREAIILDGQLVWDTLIYKPAEGPYEPLLATSWKWIDNTTIEFKLRKDVTWHDGKPFTIADAVYTFNYVSDPKNGVNVQSNVNWIAGAEAADDETLRLTLKKPFPAALEYVSTLLPIVPEGFYGDKGVAGSNGRLVGTGPYEIKEFVPGSTIRLAAFNGYFDGSPKGKPTFAGVVYRNIPDTSTQIAELLSGGIDWIWRVQPDQAKSLAGMPGIKTLSDETMRISFLSMNLRDMEGGNPLQDIRVRQAIAWAIDRNEIVKQVIGTGSNVINSPCFRTQFGCVKDVNEIGYDPEKARALLAEAGYPNGLSLKMVSYENREWVEALSGYLAAVGIKLDVSVLDYKTARDRVVNNQANLMMGNWGSYSINDVSALLNNFFTMSPDDQARDQTVADALLAAAQTADPEARMKDYDYAVRRIAGELYWYPLWTHPTTYAFNADLDFRSFPDENPRFFLDRWTNR